VAVASASAAISSNTDTTAKIKVTASAYLTDGWVQSTGIVAIITINGSTSTKTILGNGASYSASDGTKSVTYEVTVNKTAAAKSITWSVEFWQYTDGTKQAKKQTNSGTVAVAAKTSYKITYDAKGGKGAPDAQTKWYGTALTLATKTPTRDGYTFLGWSTSSTATAADGAYDPGDTYTTNAARTLYAVWKAITYTVTFHANGGTGAPAAQTKTHGSALALSPTIPTRANYTFKGWGTLASSTVATYSAGGSYTADASATLYAVWELSYIKPRITDVVVNRCKSSTDGTASDTGNYAKIAFSWETSVANPTIKIEWKLSTATSYPSGNVYTITGTNKAGTVSQIIGGGALNADNTYTVRITVTDSVDSSNLTRSVTGAKYLIDLRAGGTGVAIGKAAETDNLFDVGWTSRLRSDVLIGEKTGYRDGNPGVYIDAEGFMHLQRSTAQSGNYTYIGFYGGAGTGSPDATIRYNHETGAKLLEFAAASGYVFDNHLYLGNNDAICIANKAGAYRHMMTWNDSNNVHFAAGSYDSNEGDVYYNGNTVNIRSKTDIGFTIGNAGGALFYPYYKPGDVITTTNVLYLSGYTNSSGTQLRLFIPLAKPAVGCSTVAVSGGTWNAYQGSTAYPLTLSGAIIASIRSNTGSGNLYSGINLQANFSGHTLAGNSPVGVYISGATITFG
jgi:uncharacterized repeat protein (TIGR02543 family)